MSRNIKIKQQYSINLGKYILDSLSIGMYNHPLMALREYIQNSVDSLDELSYEESDLNKDRPHIEITIDGRKKSLAIWDNGIGIPFYKARRILLDLGRSEKDPRYSRGFRGIGRLGGLGFCNELIFTTKSRGEKQQSINTWNCQKLKQLIADTTNSLDITSLMDSVVTFKQNNYEGSPNDHFFKVEMNSICDGKNVLINVPNIISYVAQVAPVPFHPSEFTFGFQINKKLKDNIPNYRTYDIFVNGQKIFKPYSDVVRLNRDSTKEIKEIKYIELSGESGTLGFGWIANFDLQGSINSKAGNDGLRLRLGNILIGNKDLLSEFFREKRFNSYLIGEIHIIDDRLIPNSRRDDFEDNDIKTEFFNTFIKEIGLPFSKKIRELSNERSKNKRSSDANQLFINAQRIISKGYISEYQKDDIRRRLLEINGKNSKEEKVIAFELANKLLKSQHVLAKLDGSYPSISSLELFKDTLNIVYQNIKYRSDAEQFIIKIYEEIEKNI